MALIALGFNNDVLISFWLSVCEEIAFYCLASFFQRARPSLLEVLFIIPHSGLKVFVDGSYYVR